ncbi:MAG: hypothetical protein FH756_04065 [Firmicutes bacterium]|nr:hypothetical protein [Bacillota bacterium]
MIIKKTIILSVVVLLLISVAGCKKNPVQAPQNSEQKVSTEYGEITDPEELEKFWQEYFYDTIATIGNTRKFNSAEEIDPVGVAKFCWRKYVAEHGKESLKLASENSNRWLFPLDTVLEYAERYFNLTDLDVTDINDAYYDREKRAFIFYYSDKEERPSHTERNSWGTHLDKVTKNSDDTVTAVLVRYDSSKANRVKLTMTYTLKQREDGSLYFVNGRWHYINNHLVSLSGDYQHFDQIEGFDGSLRELSMLGEDNNRLILAHTPYDERENASLMLLNPESMKVEKKLTLKANFGSTDVRLAGDKIMVRLEERIVIVDKTLKYSEEIPLPGAIKDKIKSSSNPDTYFGGYDISSDLKRIVYADEKGVKVFNLADSGEKLLAPTKHITGSELIQNSYHSSPRFVDNDQKVITTMTGYESAVGYTLYSLKENTTLKYGIASGASSSGFIRYDTGLLELKSTYIKEEQTTERLQYLDFNTGNVKEIKLGDIDDGGYIRFHGSAYVGQNYAAFLTHRFDTDNGDNNMHYLYRLNLKTLKVDSKIVSVKAAETHILGVLADGRVLFWYNLNPSENGLCIAKS